MKKVIITIILLIGLFSPLQELKAQFITYDPAQFLNALAQIGKAGVQIRRAVETIQEIKSHVEVAKRTKAQLEEIWYLQKKVREDLTKLKGLKNLRWHDLQNVFEHAMFLVDNPNGYLRYQFPHVAQLHQKLSSGHTAADVRDLYEFFYRFNTAYDPAIDFEEQLSQEFDSQEKTYAAELMIQKRRFHLSMTYANMAEEMALKAEELRQKVKQEQELEMTAGERILAQKAAQDAMIQSIELQEKSSKLLAEALQKGPVQEAVDQSAYYSLRLQKQTKAYESIIPGFNE